MANKSNDSYLVRITGEGLSPVSGATPDDMGKLILKPNASTQPLRLQIIQKQIELCLEKDDVSGATDALKTFNQEQEVFNCPLNVFQRDHQNRDAPFIGAHSILGSIRDTISDSYYAEIHVYKRGMKGMTSYRSPKILRNQIDVTPNHIFFYRDGALITSHDLIDDQQPVGDVKGFARYEIINIPWEFSFEVFIDPGPPFEALGDRDLMRKILFRAAMHRVGSRRSANFGQWRIKKYEVENISLYDYMEAKAA